MRVCARWWAPIVRRRYGRDASGAVSLSIFGWLGLAVTPLMMLLEVVCLLVGSMSSAPLTLQAEGASSPWRRHHASSEAPPSPSCTVRGGVYEGCGCGDRGR